MFVRKWGRWRQMRRKIGEERFGKEKVLPGKQRIMRRKSAGMEIEEALSPPFEISLSDADIGNL